MLSTRSGGRGGFAYLDAGQMTQARALVMAYRDYRAGLRRLRQVNGQLVSLLRRYQDATARRGGRKVGVTPSSTS